MKYLSYILALWVLLLSTAPCFLQDECLLRCVNESQEEACTNDDCCGDCCCSPFLHCNTCTGCTELKLFHPSFVVNIELNNHLFTFYREKLIPKFSSSIWQPPKIVKA